MRSNVESRRRLHHCNKTGNRVLYLYKYSIPCFLFAHQSCVEFGCLLFLKDKIDCHNQADKSCQMIPFQFHAEGYHRKNGENSKCNHLLYHL